jgi:zinc D-Ala-D-Ala carboxypeptidase
MKKLLILLLLALIAVLPLITFAQSAADKPVDESTVIFAGCRLSNLQAAYPGKKDDNGVPIPLEEDPSGLDEEDIDETDELEDETDIADDKELEKAKGSIEATAIKNKYIKGCIQEIIRFIIIIAALAAILSIAVSGILQLTDQNAKPIKTKLTNTIIGLFLLIVGWNLIPIFNNSFNNVNFLSLPGVDVCTQTKYCTSEAQQQQIKYSTCMKSYQAIKEDKQFAESDTLKQNLENCIAEFCKVKDQYPKIKSKNCLDYTKPGSIVAKIKALIIEGDKERAARMAAPTPGSSAPDASCPEPEKGPKALAAGLTHYKYKEAAASDLVSIEGKKLHIDAAKAYTEMKTAAAKEGVNFKILSAFRSVADQQAIVNAKKKNGQSDKKIYTSSSEPGYSEHHTGMAMDLNSLNPSFGRTKEGIWLEANASKYGFELSFPRGNKQNITYEPWHIRYIKTDPKMFCFAQKK